MSGRSAVDGRGLIVDAMGAVRRDGQARDEGGRHQAGHGARGEHGARRRHEQDARPRRAGPSMRPVPSTVPESPFAAASSSGVRDTLGGSAPWVGRVMVSEDAAAAAPR